MLGNGGVTYVGDSGDPGAQTVLTLTVLELGG